MKRLLIGFAAVLAVLGGLALAAPFVISTEIVRQRIADQITHWTGREVSFVGEPKIDLFPYLTVRLRDVTIANPPGMDGEPFVRMEGLIGKIEILPLLLGRIEFAQFRLMKPHFNLVRDASGRANWLLSQGVVGTQAAKGDSELISDDVAPPSPLAEIELGRFIVRDGDLTLADAATGYRDAVKAINIDFAWPSTAKAAAGGGTFVWRDQPVEFSGSIATPLQFVAGGASAIRLAVASAPLKFTFDGNALRLDGVQFEGLAEASTPSVRKVAAWFGMPAELGPTFGAGSISGRLNWVGSAMSFDEASLTLDGNSAEGALSLGFGKGLSLSGTLAAERLDLTAYFEAAEASLASGGEWTTAPAALPLAGIDEIDLRLSAGQTTVGGAHFGHTAAAVTARDGRFVVDIGEVQFHTGRAEANLALDTTGAGMLATGTVKIDDLPVGAAFGELFGLSGFNATGNGALSLSASGTTLGALVASLTGDGEIALADGVVKGVDLTAGSGLFDGSGSAWTGATAFSTAAAALRVADGAISLDSLRAEGVGFTLALDGAVRLLEQTIEGRGVVTLSAGTDAPREVPFRVGGTWNEPVVAPDLGAPINRSSIQTQGAVDLLPWPNG